MTGRSLAEPASAARLVIDVQNDHVEDCCAGSEAGLHVATLENVRRHFETVVTAAEIETWWAFR